MTNRPSTYVTRPVEIQAMLLTEDTVNDLLKWIHDNGIEAEFGAHDGTSQALLTIHTDWGARSAAVGDYIVRSSGGEFYPVSSDTFQDTYEPVDPNTYAIRVMFTDGNVELFGPYDKLSDAKLMLQSRVVDQDMAPGPHIEPIVKAEVVILTEGINCSNRAVSLLGRRFMETGVAAS